MAVFKWVIIEKQPMFSSPDSSGNPFYFFFEIKRLKRIAGVFVLKKNNSCCSKKDPTKYSFAGFGLTITFINSSKFLEHHFLNQFFKRFNNFFRFRTRSIININIIPSNDSVSSYDESGGNRKNAAVAIVNFF